MQFRDAPQGNFCFLIPSRGTQCACQQIEQSGFVAIHLGRLLQVAHGICIVMQLQLSFAKIKIRSPRVRIERASLGGRAEAGQLDCKKNRLTIILLRKSITLRTNYRKT